MLPTDVDSNLHSTRILSYFVFGVTYPSPSKIKVNFIAKWKEDVMFQHTRINLR